MKKLLSLIAASLLLFSCAKQATVPVYVWTGGNPDDEAALRQNFELWKSHGVTGVCYGLGWNTEAIAKVSAMAHEYGMEYHAWVGCATQGGHDRSWYTVNRLGQNALDNPPYVPYYTTLDPHNPDVVDFLATKCCEIADIPTVDYVQLDYIRYADVILAKGLWNKYGLVMDEEYAPADFCYCDDCVADFKAQTGIDIRKVEDPSKCEEWAAFRCQSVTKCVNAIAEAVHAKGKKVSADVFPGPDSHARWMVRQQWDEWNVDALFPMNYNDFYLEPAEWVGEITKEETASIAGKGEKLYSGLFICRDWRNKANIADPEGHGLNPMELEVAVNGAMKAGADGICLFSTGSMTDEHWEALDKLIGLK